MRYALILTAGAATLFGAYIDGDLDGVDDRIDRCPQTPFEELADRYGCSPSQQHIHMLAQVGVSFAHDDALRNETSLDMYVQLSYKRWEVSFATVFAGASDAMLDNTNDLYVTVGSVIDTEITATRLFAGGKVTIDNDNALFAGIECYTPVTSTLYGRIYYGYTHTLSTHTQDYHTLIATAGYRPTSKWDTELSYRYVTAYQKDGDTIDSLSLFVRRWIDDRHYIAAFYAHDFGLSDNHTVSFMIGVSF